MILTLRGFTSDGNRPWALSKLQNKGYTRDMPELKCLPDTF